MHNAVREFVIKSNHSEQWNAALCTLTLRDIFLFIVWESCFDAPFRNWGNWWDNSKLLHGRYSVRTATTLPTTVSACQDSKVQRSTNFPKIKKMPQICKRTKWRHQASSLSKMLKIWHHHLKFGRSGDMVGGIWAPQVEWPQHEARD
jgi:hypothetical protein